MVLILFSYWSKRIGMKSMLCIVTSVFLYFVCLGCSTQRSHADGEATGLAGHEKSLPDIIGSTHTKANYYFGTQDSLNEGADRLLEMGSRVIKVWFYMGKETPDVMYPWNSTWPKVNTAVEGAQLPYWKKFFHKPFTTYILQTMEMVPEKDYYWRENFTQEQEQEVERQMYELAKYFLTEYQGTGKTFIVSNHETDWHLEGDLGNWDAVAADHVYANAIRWFNARQRGVERARQDVRAKDVYVWHAGEVVHVVKSMKEGQKNMVNVILPKVKFDLISYSSWDSTVIGGLRDFNEITQALDYIETQAIDSPYFGKKNVFIGEFGQPENDYDAEQVLALSRNVVEKGLAWGCPYIVYWQLYCNEPRPGVKLPAAKNADSRGFWLIRADGSKPLVYDYYKELLKKRDCRGG
jgi:hypothetical protein